MFDIDYGLSGSKALAGARIETKVLTVANQDALQRRKVDSNQRVRWSSPVCFYILNSTYQSCAVVRLVGLQTGSVEHILDLMCPQTLVTTTIAFHNEFAIPRFLYPQN